MKNRLWLFRLLLAFSIITCTAVSASPPNVIFILADDMGYGDPGCYNPASTIPTPNMNRLAAEGMRFTDAHTPSAVCTPTRYGVLTGRYCWRSRMKRGVLGGYSPPLIEPDRLTVAAMLKQAGYSTAVIGKWHLGLAWVARDKAKLPDALGGKMNESKVDFTRPLKAGAHTVGFDYSYLVPASLDMPPYVYVENGKATQVPSKRWPAGAFPRYTRKGLIADNFDMERTLDHLAEKAVAYIEQQAKSTRPFFMYFPLTAPHKPAWPAQRFRGKTGLGPYGDFIVQVDWTVGQVLAALDKSGIAEQTLIMLTSDNGSYMFRMKPGERDHVEQAGVQGFRSEHHAANGPLRGTKADIWEAGHRVPFLARWPGRIKNGSICDTTICLTDVMATCADIAAVDLPGRAGEDSFSFLPDLLGKDRPAPRAPVIHHSANGMFAIRDGKWKLVLGNGSGGRQMPRGKPFARPFELYDLKADLGEEKNLAPNQPELTSRMERKAKTIRESGRSR